MKKKSLRDYFVKSFLTEFIMLFTFWLLLNFRLSIEIIISGLFVSGLVTHFTRKVLFTDNESVIVFPAIWRLIWFGYIVIIEIFIAAAQHIIRIIKKEGTPIIFRLKLDTDNPLIITLIANAITLTPGTITLTAEGSNLTVLSFDSTDEKMTKTKDIILVNYQKPFKDR